MSKPKKYLSPRGPFMYPKLNDPDYGTKDYPDHDGNYNVQQVFIEGSPEAKYMLDILSPLMEASIAEGKEKAASQSAKARKDLEKRNGKDLVFVKDFYTELLDKETEEPTGQIAFRFKMKASGERKKGPKAGTRWERKPLIYDAKGHLMANIPEIWGGTEGKISFSVRPYFISSDGAVGLTLQLEAAQIIELVSGGSRKASEFGFGEEEGGYEHDDAAYKDDETDDEFGDETGDVGGSSDAEQKGDF